MNQKKSEKPFYKYINLTYIHVTKKTSPKKKSITHKHMTRRETPKKIIAHIHVMIKRKTHELFFKKIMEP